MTLFANLNLGCLKGLSGCRHSRPKQIREALAMVERGRAKDGRNGFPDAFRKSILCPHPHVCRPLREGRKDSDETCRPLKEAT
jgi:hypothetical protein